MEDLLNETVSNEDLMKFERKYQGEFDANNVTFKTQFEYAWCLVRSQYSSDIQKGILLLEDLTTRHSDGKRDYIYYLAIGNTRLKRYTESLKYCKAFLQIEPNNQQVTALQRHIESKSDSEFIKGVAVAGSAFLVIGGLVGVGLALAKK